MMTADSTPALKRFEDERAGVVEVALLLPANRLTELMNLSTRLDTSVAAILRQWIDRGLADNR